MRNIFDQTEGLIQVEDTRPLPGIDWQIDVDIEKAGRYERCRHSGRNDGW